MSQLHSALETLRPKDISDVPLDEPDAFAQDIFTQAAFIVNSVPEPPNSNKDGVLAEGPPNTATCAAQIKASQLSPVSPDPIAAGLHKQWGKPVKIKDNPLEIPVYKMAANDKYGAWFGRRSVHEGLGFARWKAAMEREFAESLAVQGGPGEGSIRGIGSDQRLEQRVIDGIGKLEVYQLSMGFPAPTSPREFVTLLLTSDTALKHPDNVRNDAVKTGAKEPRYYIIVSIPITHPDAPPRKGLVRGQYESVEMIREVLSHESDPECNPVEWIMVTRSDPGGGIPRFLVERSTPSSIVADAGKFLDWACSVDMTSAKAVDATEEATDERHTVEPQQPPKPMDHSPAQPGNGHLVGAGKSVADKAPVASDETPAYLTDSGIMSSITGAVEAGLANYAPQIVQNNLPQTMQDAIRRAEEESSSDESESDTDSFASAEQFTTANDTIPPLRDLSSSSDSLSITSSQVSQPVANPLSPRATSRQDRELEKLSEKRRELEKLLAERRQLDDGTPSEQTKKQEKLAEKARAKHEREIQKREHKYKRELEKLEKRREKVLRKDAVKRLGKERDEWKGLAQTMEKENKLLKDQVGSLQREVTALVAQLGRLEGGKSALTAVKDEIEQSRKRGSSIGSRASKESVKSK